MKPLNVNLLRKRERDEKQDALKREESMLNHPKIEDKTQIKKNIAHLSKQLHDYSPEPLAPAEKDKLHNLEKQLAEKIRQGMPTDETMRKNPVGAIDAHSAWEKAKKKLILAWKNVRIQLNPDSDDRDLANVERLRPSGAMDRLRTDAQIGGHMTYGSVPEENWPFEPPQETALEQAKRAQDRIAQSVAEAEALVGETPRPVSGPPPVVYPPVRLRREMSEEAKQAARDRLARAREAKRVKAMAARHGEVDIEVQTVGVPVGNHADVAAPVA